MVPERQTDVRDVIACYTYHPGQLTWKQIWLCLQNEFLMNDEQEIFFDFYARYNDGRTILHCHFNLRDILSGDHDEVAVARFWIEESMELQTTNLDGRDHESVLTVPDDNKATPIHYLFSIPRDFDITPYVELIIEMSDKVDDKISSSSYWNELMSQQDEDGRTPLHLLADADYNQQTDLVLRVVVQTHEVHSRCDTLMHPLLITDYEGDLPIHNVCSTAVDLDLFKAIVGVSDNNYEASYDAVFHSNNEGEIPVIRLLRAFIEDVLFIEDVHSLRTRIDSVEFELFCEAHHWWPGQEYAVRSFQCLLSSSIYSNEVFDFSILRECYNEIVWPRVEVLLEAAVKSNIHQRHDHNNTQAKEDYGISDEPLHLAASVENFPSFVLQLEVLNDPLALLRRDSIGRIPLHYAIVASPGIPGIQNHREGAQEMAVYWRSYSEPRSMIQYLLDNAPGSASIECTDGRLPLHLAIVHGCDLESVVNPIVTLSPQQIIASDPVTNLKPFMLAASNDLTSLDVVYRLLAIDPSLLETALR